MSNSQYPKPLAISGLFAFLFTTLDVLAALPPLLTRLLGFANVARIRTASEATD